MSLSLQEQFTEINGRLIETRKAIEERDRVLALLDTLDHQLAETIEERDFLLKIAQQEKADVDKLEGLSVTAVFAKLRGNHEEKLEKEVAEYLEIKMGLEAREIALQSLQNNHQELEMMLVALANCDEEHEQAKREQKQFLIQHHKVNPKKLEALPNLIAPKNRYLHEIEEALEIANTIDEQMSALFKLVSQSRRIDYYKNDIGILTRALSKSAYTGTGRALLHAAKIEPQFKLLQAELADIDAPFAREIDLRIPKFSTVMVTAGDDQNQEAHRMRNFRHWLKHLTNVYERLMQKITVLEKKKQITTEEITNLQAEQQALIDKLWRDAEENNAGK